MKFKNKFSKVVYDTKDNMVIEVNEQINVAIKTPDGLQILGIYDDFSTFCDEWEGVKEPKIEDEETRKAIKAWAKVNRIDKVGVHQTDHRWYLRGFNDREQGVDIDFFGYDMPKGLIGSNPYTITELCGEEEE